MKKIWYILIGLLLIVLGEPAFAQSEIPGLIHGGQYRIGTLSGVVQPKPIQQSSDAIYSVGSYPLYTPELARGEGREIIQIYCRFCHSATYITMQPPFPAATWEAEVYKMINTYGAPIPADAVKQITAYLKTYYTPETREQ